MGINLSQLVNVSSSSQNDATEITISPDPSISLEADDVDEAITELAGDIHDLNNMPSITLNYALQRNA